MRNQNRETADESGEQTSHRPGGAHLEMGVAAGVGPVATRLLSMDA